MEARDRVGGRVENFHLSNGGVTELGAAFVGPTQDHVLDLAKDLGLETFLEHNEGQNEAFLNGQRLTYSASDALPQLDAETTTQIVTAVGGLDGLASSIDPHAPWSHPNATELDGTTFATWINSTVTSETVRELLGITSGAVWSATPEELSLLYVLAYIAGAGNETATGNLERLIGVTGGAQASRIVGGTGLLATGLASKIGWHNIHLNSPVKSIVRSHNGSYTVTSSSGKIAAKSVIVAMSPPLAARITYSPLLPAKRDQLTQRYFMGALGKATAIYSEPSWRAANISGQVLSSTGNVRTTFDVSPANASYGAILGFLEADEMRALDPLSEAEIIAKVQEDYVQYFGPEAANATQWVIKRWDNEEWSRGGPVALAGPGTLTRYGTALREVVGGIHWAGTETSPYWTGYMDGALRSGERAAEEILAGESR